MQKLDEQAISIWQSLKYTATSQILWKQKCIEHTDPNKVIGSKAQYLKLSTTFSQKQLLKKTHNVIKLMTWSHCIL